MDTIPMNKLNSTTGNRFDNIAKNYYAIAMGTVPEVNIDWKTDTDKIEDCNLWLMRHFPEIMENKDILNYMTDELWYYTGEYQEVGFIKGFTLAMDLMTKSQ